MATAGIDFLRAHCLSVNPVDSRLVQAGTRLVFPAITSASSSTASAILTELGAITTSFSVPDGQVVLIVELP